METNKDFEQKQECINEAVLSTLNFLIGLQILIFLSLGLLILVVTI